MATITKKKSPPYAPYVALLLKHHHVATSLACKPHELAKYQVRQKDLPSMTVVPRGSSSKPPFASTSEAEIQDDAPRVRRKNAMPLGPFGFGEPNMEEMKKLS